MKHARVLLLAVVLVSCSSGTKTDVDSTPTASSSAQSATGANPAKLPLGDGKYGTAAAKGSVFSCITQFNGQGAQANGPWIDESAKTWDSTKKSAIAGSVKRTSTFAYKVSDDRLVLTGNGFPTTPTGVFPVASSDPAYQYDRNPNSITSYTLSVSLPAHPVAASTPSCVGGTIGMSTLGVPIYSAFDALGRDAGAHEVQDTCGGHPQRSGQYHFHTLSPCWDDSSLSKQTNLVGWALDGFGIYVEKNTNGTMLGSADLDECHGRTSTVTFNGASASMYHYVATEDFPYFVACYRGTPITSATGLGIGASG